MAETEKKLPCDYKDELKKAHRLSDELAENIATMIDSMVYTYGSDYEDVILNAFKSCKFKVAKTKKSGTMETVEEMLRVEEALEVVEGLNDRDLKTASVAFGSSPVISSNDGNYRIDGINRVMALSSRFSWDNPDSLYYLASECEKLVNSCLNGYSIEGNTLTVKEGLRTRTETLKQEKGNVTRTLASDEGFGLERGINLYNAWKTTRKNHSPSYDATGFDYARLTGGYLLDNLGLVETIRNARLTKDQAELKNAIDTIAPSGYGALMASLDELDRLEKRRMNSIFDNEELIRISSEMDSHFRNEVAPLVSEMTASMGLEEGMQSVIK